MDGHAKQQHVSNRGAMLHVRRKRVAGRAHFGEGAPSLLDERLDGLQQGPGGALADFDEDLARKQLCLRFESL